jgi:hypothetical protein
MAKGWRRESKRHSLSARGIKTVREHSDYEMHSEPKVLKQTQVPDLKKGEYELEFYSYDNAKNFFKSIGSGSMYYYMGAYRVVYNRDERLKSIASSTIRSSANEFVPGTKVYYLVQRNGKLVFSEDRNGLPLVFNSLRSAQKAKKIAKEWFK